MSAPAKPLGADEQALRAARGQLRFDLNRRIAAWSARGEQVVMDAIRGRAKETAPRD